MTGKEQEALIHIEAVLCFHVGSQFIREVEPDFRNWKTGRVTQPIVELNYEDLLDLLRTAREALGMLPMPCTICGDSQLVYPQNPADPHAEPRIGTGVPCECAAPEKEQ